MRTEARHNAEATRYELVSDGRVVSVAEYRMRGETFVFTHTETAEELRGNGLAGRLVEFALDDVRSRGGTVIPRCPFVRNFIEAHPQYGDLLAA